MAHLAEPYVNVEPRMFCPICHRRLCYGGVERYETLANHVSNPNAKPPLRAKFVCLKKKCTYNFYDSGGVFFGVEGSAYSGVFNMPMEYWEAIGSWNWWYERHKAPKARRSLRKYAKTQGRKEVKKT
jgi:hypothetical protein